MPPPVRRLYIELPPPALAPERAGSADGVLGVAVLGAVPLGCARPPALAARWFGTLLLFGFGLPALLCDNL